MPKNYDFSGYATKNDLLCSDGRVIKRDAFKDCDGCVVPLVWNHEHKEPTNILGHALLENRSDGVYAYCSFNDTESGQRAKKIVEHGDIKSLSIWANKLKHNGSNVVHGTIKEVSLVLAGANPGAFIENVMSHGEELEDETIFCFGDEISLEHSEELSNEDTPEEPEESTEPEEKEPEEPAENKEPEVIEHSEEGTKMPEAEKTVQDVIDTMNEEQKNVLYGLVGQALESANGNKEGDNMKHNLFENEEDTAVLAHAEEDIYAAINDAKSGHRSMKDSFLAHGIEDIDYLFPDARNITDKPTFINTNPIAWVKVIMDGIHHVPFSRIKMMHADITMDEARAKGYFKGNYKKEETFKLLKRTVDPCTVYKKQKLNRDDIIDITDLNVVAWVKAEMRMKLDEELARSFVFGDGRSVGDEDKISEEHIIPVVSDTTNNLYAMEYTVTPAQGETMGHALINAMVKAMDDYEGSGNVVAFIKQSMASDIVLLEDKMGHRLYKGMDDIATAMTIDKVVKVPAKVFPENVISVALDLRDYSVGADKGGAVNMFEDFDIDFNAEKYLMETRCSGALTVPHSAIILKVAGE